MNFPYSSIIVNEPIGIPARHYCLRMHSLLSFYEIKNPDYEETLLVIRNAIGRFVWRVKVQYRLSDPPINDTSQFNPTIVIPPNYIHTEEVSEDMVDDLTEYENDL